MLTDEQSGRNRLPPMLTSPPPPKRHKSESTSASDAGRASRYYHAGSVPSSERYYSSSIPATDRFQPSSIPPHDRHPSASIPATDRYQCSPVPAGERSRQTSTAMDIYTITDRNPADKDGDRRTGRFLSNGSVASQRSQASRASGSSPPVIITNRKYVVLPSFPSSQTNASPIQVSGPLFTASIYS
ncbi:Secondary metabolism regulator laeA [Penicillium diatomitis]|uniref:Secondary metabolism regulator laeA n=1 Tax=Penicillium diatomitis TaxID=2819901 RepID=A0A9W9XFD2_9EURO|nr:Secondary metabolism regulator laeA [Penicillium diatomitis]KAJ5491259.1 Secondary metabolism regulator laeA [Penicillium diatomitis]